MAGFSQDLLPGPPPGFTLDDNGGRQDGGAFDFNARPTAPPQRSPRLVPVSNAATIARTIWPQVQITDWTRDPNSALGRANPSSWHVRSRAAIDARPMPGTTFDQYVQRYRDAGFEPLEAIDEVHHPSAHATGPHWHLVLGYDPHNIPGAVPASSDDAAARPDLLGAPPPGFVLDQPEAPAPDQGLGQDIAAMNRGYVDGLTSRPVAPAGPRPRPVPTTLEMAHGQTGADLGQINLARHALAAVWPRIIAMQRSTDPGVHAEGNRQAAALTASAQQLNQAEAQVRAAGSRLDQAVHYQPPREVGYGEIIRNNLLRGLEDTAVMGIQVGLGQTPGSPGSRLTSDVVEHGSDYLGVTDPGIDAAPQTTGQRYAAGISRFVGGSIVPEAGVIGAGRSLIRRGAAELPEALSWGQRAAVEAAQHPLRVGAATLTGGAGSVAGGDAAEAVGLPRPVGEIVGGLVGGGAPYAVRPRPHVAAPDNLPPPPAGFAIDPAPDGGPRQFYGEAGAPTRVPDRLDLSTPARTAPAGMEAEPPLTQQELDDLMGVGPEELRRDGQVTPPQWLLEPNPGTVTPAVEARARALGAGGVEYPEAPPADSLPNSLGSGRRPLTLNEDSGIEPDPSISGPLVRRPDRIDLNGLPPPPPGFTLEPQIGRVFPLGEQPDPAELAAAARSIRPEDVLPIPGNQVESEAEAARANPGSFRPVDARAPQLAMRALPDLGNPGETLNHRGPLDAEAFLRRRGGIRDDDGELRHMGITNAARPGVSGDRVLGPIINPEGMSPDEAARSLWEGGYLPHLTERPDIGDLHAALTAGRNGFRVFHPEDWDEIAQHEAATADYHRALDAEQEGAPLAERIGQPVGPGDLDANAPPATAYEDLPRVGGSVGNINLSHIESSSDIRRLLSNVETRFGGFDGARRGVITHGETQALADELGMTADDLLRRRHGQALNAEQALAARQLLAKSSDEVIALARRATGPEASDVSRAAFAEALLRHAAIHEQVAGMTAEAGRALSAFRAAAKARNIADDIHRAAITGMGGTRRLEEVADGILELQRQGTPPGEVTRFAVNATKPRFRDKLIELWYNSLLSGPRTHAVNIVSNLTTAALQIPEHAAAASLGGVRRLANSIFGRPDDFDRVMGSEIGPRAWGMIQGAREGLGAFTRTLRTGEVADHVTKVEARVQHAIGGVTGDIIRTPTRLLAAEDEFFKSISQRMELNGLAIRQAYSEGLRGEAAQNRALDLARNPTDDMLAKSMDYARYTTFQRPLTPDRLGFHVTRATEAVPILKLFIPFVRTPANLLRFAAERSPLAPLLKEVRADFRAGGARRDLAVSRMALGTGLGMLVTNLAQRGLISGAGPADPGARQLMQADGWQPYSIRVGDTWVSYGRLDPLSTTMGVAADLVDVQQHMTAGQRQQAASLLVASIVHNLANKTWLSGLSDLMNAMTDPQRSLSRIGARTAASIAVPALVSQTAGVLDPSMRDTRSPSFDTSGVPETGGARALLDPMLGEIQSRVPGWSRSLPARRDVWGDPVQRSEAIGPDIISPFSTRTAGNDRVTRELLDLGVDIGQPASTIGGVRLTERQASDYAALSGRYMRGDLQAAIADPSWQQMSRAERISAVSTIKRQARADARADLGLAADDGEGAPALPPPPSGFRLDAPH